MEVRAKAEILLSPHPDTDLPPEMKKEGVTGRFLLRTVVTSDLGGFQEIWTSSTTGALKTHRATGK